MQLSTPLRDASSKGTTHKELHRQMSTNLNFVFLFQAARAQTQVSDDGVELSLLALHLIANGAKLVGEVVQHLLQLLLGPLALNHFGLQVQQSSAQV